MAAEEEAGFSVVDKRRVQPESGDDADASRPATPDLPPMMDEEAHDTGLPSLGVRDRLLMCIDILYQGAWISMGLVADPATGEIRRELPEAKKAIDCIAFLAERVETELDEATRREVKRLVSDLQINFVRQSQQ